MLGQQLRSRQTSQVWCHFADVEVYLLVLYALVIFPSVSVCVIEAEFMLLGF